MTARPRLRQAITLSLRARDTALQAGKLLREEVTLQRRAQRVLEQARDALGRAHDQVSESGDANLRELLRRVQSQVERAERQYRDGDFEVSLRLGQAALELMRSAAARLDGPGLARRYESMLDQARRFLDEAGQHRDTMSPSQRQRFDRAADLLRRSEEQFRSGHPRRAMDLLERARSLGRAFDAGVNGPDAEQIRQAVDRVERALADLGEQLDARTPSHVRRMYDRAREEHDRSLRALGAGDLPKAIRHHRATVDLLTRIRNWLDDRSR